MDALHVAIAALNQADYLLTWNCAHLANASFRLPLQSACTREGLTAPVICTPFELM